MDIQKMKIEEVVEKINLLYKESQERVKCRRKRFTRSIKKEIFR